MVETHIHTHKMASLWAFSTTRAIFCSASLSRRAYRQIIKTHLMVFVGLYQLIAKHFSASVQKKGGRPPKPTYCQIVVMIIGFYLLLFFCFVLHVFLLMCQVFKKSLFFPTVVIAFCVSPGAQILLFILIPSCTLMECGMDFGRKYSNPEP